MCRPNSLEHLQLKINGCINQSSNADTNIDARKDMSKLRQIIPQCGPENLKKSRPKKNHENEIK